MKVDYFIYRMALGAKELINCREIRTSFHFDVGIPLAVNHIHDGGVLEKCSPNGDSFLII